MTPTPAWSKAVALYTDPSQMDRDREAIKACGGTVIETPEFILWGFPFDSCCVQEGVQIPLPGYTLSHVDAWFCWMLAGDTAAAVQAVPYPLEWLIFARRNKLRAYKFDGLVKRLTQPTCNNEHLQNPLRSPSHVS